jgi:tRNA threonylcarbamoyl adenosine modification protein YjeE
MVPDKPVGPSFDIVLASKDATERLAGDIADALQPGDLITLSGDLGAGKTTFARALIRHLAGDPTLAVPSPTFTLLQTYDTPRFPIAHADFYRLSGAEDLRELGLDDLPDGTVVLVEWPDRAAGELSASRLDVALSLLPQRGPDYRTARITGTAAFARRAERLMKARQFLEDTGFGNAQRSRMQGDASTRSYDRVTLPDRCAILMNAARRPDGPPVRGGKSYSAIAHLAEDVTPFVAMARGLRERGFSAPQIYGADLDAGLLLLEDLGAGQVVTGDPPAPIASRYAAAVDVLVALHGQTLPARLPVSPGLDYLLPSYDLDAFLIEAELLLDWYLPRQAVTVTSTLRAEFMALWSAALQAAEQAEATWVLRDYHSPNLLWLPDRSGLARVGLLDFQDAVMGPSAYDLASLLQDARVDVPEELETAQRSRYVVARRTAESGFDGAAFEALYAIVAAQRATKILGIFARLERRDGKPQYLRHMPRVWSYLQRSLAHPALLRLRGWFDRHVPTPR